MNGDDPRASGRSRSRTGSAARLDGRVGTGRDRRAIRANGGIAAPAWAGGVDRSRPGDTGN